MQFKKFTNAAGGNHIFLATKAVVMAITLLFWLSACTATTTVDKNQENAVTTPLFTDENIAKEGLIKENLINESDTEKTAVQSKKAPAINLYLQQQASQTTIIPAKVLKDYQQAISFMEDKKWQQAQLLFDQVILAQPQLSGSYVNKAIIAKQQDKLTQAQALLNKAIAANKLNLYAHHLQGKIYRLQGQFDNAEQSYLAALAIWPDFVQAHASMAILLELYRGRLLDAHGYYRSYLLLNSDDEEVKRWQAGLEIKIKRAGLTVPIVEKTEPPIIKPSVELPSDDDEEMVDEKQESTNKVEEPDHG